MACRLKEKSLFAKAFLEFKPQYDIEKGIYRNNESGNLYLLKMKNYENSDYHWCNRTGWK